MERTPNTPNALVQTRNWLSHPLQLLSARIPQQICLLLDALASQVLDAYRSLLAVDEVGYDDGMPSWPWRDCDFDLWVFPGEGGEVGADEGVHAARGAGPVAVVKVEAFALEDEGTDAILKELEDAIEWV